MQKQPTNSSRGSMRGLRIFAAILLNLTIVLSAVYVEYHILDHFNPMLSFINGSTLPIVPYLSVIIPILFILSVLLPRRSGRQPSHSMVSPELIR